MSIRRFFLLAPALVCGLAPAAPPGQYRLVLRPEMLASSSPKADFAGLADEQLDAGDPPAGQPATPWRIPSQFNREFPFAMVVDLGEELPLARFWLHDTNNQGEVLLQTGRPDAWEELAVVRTDQYQAWRSLPVDRVSRYLRLELRDPGAIFSEILVDAYSPKGWEAVRAARAEQARLAAAREAALAQARAEALKRPLVTLAPFGRLSLVDAVDCAGDGQAHGFSESPAGASRVDTILGSPCRVLPTAAKRGSYLSYRLGRNKLLRAGGTYVLAVEYPEDAPRSLMVINAGNETSRGFHTGLALGDALHPKYVNNQVESLDLPLSGAWESWTLLFRLHDRFPEQGLPRGGGPRPLTPEDGFDVTLCQFSTHDAPLSQGVAVRAIRLYEVVDPDTLACPVNFPPEDLPRRRLFWREEMADGVIGDKDPAQRGLDEGLDWYRHKAELMRFLGMNTYSKDLLEFGACQHWDSTPGGGNDWVYHDARTKDYWERIVAMMGEYGFEILPYYEYSGSKGAKGLGFERRCKPLTRDDAYTHIKWIESANADLTDPATYEDFRRMLDCTVARFKDRARFAGIWLRPRSQLPVGFGDATRQRFAAEANGGREVTREQLREDAALYARYLAWWQGKRREFLVAMRDYLREQGVADAQVIFTGCAAEPGVGFGSWDARFVTDSPAVWSPILAREAHHARNLPMSLLTPGQVVEQGLYMQGLLTAGLAWGGWENHHANPADDPDTYREVPGVMLSHAFNRLYTVADPATLERFRSPAGLTLVRHYTLNENMMFDENDKNLLDYFIADIERAGPFCMQAEALAVAQGDPTQIGYLVGSNFGRGFPQYAREFNANFLALPALPSAVLAGATDQPAVVVRAIDAGEHGLYLAVVNTGTVPVEFRLRPPRPGKLVRLADLTPVELADGRATLRLRPCQLLALRLEVE
ncbi:MAG: hypothetical protein RBU25_12425 [Lentisphaeria bacterium]|jgi:hypothetical protein|nr:hypothetical protein [Lentisphaeria bacterium]